MLALLENTSYNIIVDHRDRLARFGVEMVEAALRQSNRRLIVINESELQENLIQDFVDLATSMCAKIYGKRSARNRAERIIKSIKDK